MDTATLVLAVVAVVLLGFLIAGLYHAGASLGSVVAFVTAWSLWSVSRLPVEMALIAPRVAPLGF